MADEVIGVIGGSGLYEMEGLTGIQQVTVDTPFGRPSDEYTTGMLDGVPMVFLPRHGKGHRFTPSEVNYRANIYGMKKLGVTRIISVSAVGSLREEIVPGHIVIPDQFIDRTRGTRKDTFFGNGVVGHVQFADPVCGELSGQLFKAAGEVGGDGAPRRHLRLHGGARLLHPRGEPPVPLLRRLDHRHDQPHRGEACPRGRDLLRRHRALHRLRLLA